MVFTLPGQPVSNPGSSNSGNNPYQFGSGSEALDLSTADGLLKVAQMQGGSLGEVANELIHPKTSILSTISDGFKNSFKEFVDIISVPSQVVAGALSTKYTVSEAVKSNISPSDIIWGEKDSDASTMKKVGGFLVRTATDILLDPLTYVTFGAGQGIAGLRGTTKVTLEETAAKTVGKETLSQAALSETGQDVFKYLKNVEQQQNGLAKALQIKSGGEVFDLAGQELEYLLRNTIDAPLNMDFAKKAISNLLEKNPALTETLLDKGGIKFFGQTLVSGQRISSALKMIPGMTVLDNITAPTRRAVAALFDPSLVKTDAGYVRVPQEALDIIQAGEDLKRARTMGKGKELSDIIRANKLTVDEAKLVTAAIEARKLPADPRLANAVKQFLGFTQDEFNFLAESGIPISMRDNHVPHILLKNNNISVGDIPMSRVPKASSMSTKTGATYERKVAETIAEAKTLGFEFDENIVTAHYARSVDNTNAGVAKQVLTSLGETMGQVKSLAPEGWVPVSMKGVNEGGKKLLQIFGEAGEEVVFHPAVAKRIENFIQSSISDDATAGLLKAFDGIQNLWKAGVTSVFPAFHGRNAISNVFLNMMDLGVHVLDPQKHLFAGQMVADDIKASRLMRESLKPGDMFDDSIFKDPELLGLAKEARKYNNVEEFIKAHEDLYVGAPPRDIERMYKKGIDGSEKMYRGIPPEYAQEVIKNKKIKAPGVEDDDLYFTKDYRYALSYAKGNPNGVVEVTLRPDDVKNLIEIGGEPHTFNIPMGNKNTRDIDIIDAKIANNLSDPEIARGQLREIYKLAQIKTNKAQEELNDLLSKTAFTDATGYTWSFGELRQVMKDRNIAFNKGLDGSLDLGEPGKLANTFFGEGTKKEMAIAKAKKALPISQDFFLFEAGRSVGSAIENQARVLNFVANLRNTGDVQLAAQRTKQFLFDYNNLTNFEKAFMKRILPFYTFTRKNLELQVKTLMTTPGRVAGEITAINNIGEALSGGELTEEEKKALPDWIKSGISILKSKKGSTVEILGSLGSPIEQPFAAFQPNVLLGSVSPLLRTPVEQMSGYSFFQGKALSDVTNAAAFKLAPKAIQDFIGFTTVKGKKTDGTPFTWYVALRPERMNIINNLPLAGRVLSSIKQMEAQDVSTQMKTMQQIIGLRPYSFDIEQEAAKREAENKKRLEELLIKAGVVAQFKRTFVPKDD